MGRKVKMLMFSFNWLGALGMAYFVVCAYLKNSPDPIIVGALFTALGTGIGSGNWANAKEHQARNQTKVDK